MVKHKAIALGSGLQVAVLLLGVVPGEGWAAEKGRSPQENSRWFSEQNSGPFDTDTDFHIAGTLGIPLLRTDPLFGQALLGEVMVGYSHTTGKITAVSPLTAVGAPAAAVTSTKLEITTLQILLGFKYRIEDAGSISSRPERDDREGEDDDSWHF